MSNPEDGVMTSEVECPACGVGWSEGRFSIDCPTCGGGAIRRNCPVCDGACGGEWRRAIQDSSDSGEAHWIGVCEYEWWLDESALPELRWARLKREAESIVIECAGLFYGFSTVDEALAWLGGEEYIPYKDAIADGVIALIVTPPRAGS